MEFIVYITLGTAAWVSFFWTMYTLHKWKNFSVKHKKWSLNGVPLPSPHDANWKRLYAGSTIELRNGPVLVEWRDWDTSSVCAKIGGLDLGYKYAQAVYRAHGTRQKMESVRKAEQALLAASGAQQQLQAAKTARRLANVSTSELADELLHREGVV